MEDCIFLVCTIEARVLGLRGEVYSKVAYVACHLKVRSATMLESRVRTCRLRRAINVQRPMMIGIGVTLADSRKRDCFRKLKATGQIEVAQSESIALLQIAVCNMPPRHTTSTRTPRQAQFNTSSDLMIYLVSSVNAFGRVSRVST